MSKFYAVIAGVGSGTGRSVALRFAKTYPLALLARNPENYDPIVTEINSSGGRAIGISTDVGDPSSITSAFSTISASFPDHKLAAAIFNASAGFPPKPFLELSLADLDTSLTVNAKGLFNFAQATLPGLLESVEEAPYSPTLIITGATASVRGSARFGAFAAGKFAVRALGQSLAREFGPRGVHVAHAIIDGVIDIPRTKHYNVNEGREDGKISADSIAEDYWHLHTQHRSGWTQELDLRPWVEKF